MQLTLCQKPPVKFILENQMVKYLSSSFVVSHLVHIMCCHDSGFSSLAEMTQLLDLIVYWPVLHVNHTM